MSCLSRFSGMCKLIATMTTTRVHSTALTIAQNVMGCSESRTVCEQGSC